MRCFIAIELPDHIRARIFHEFENLSKKDLFSGKFVEKDNLHLTLKFLGEVGEDKVEEIVGKLKEIKLKSFEVEVGKLGVFPSRDHINVIWLDILPGEKVKEINESINNVLGMSEDREFVSHLTTARVKSVKNKEKLIEELDKLHFKKLNFDVKEFILMKSQLTPFGPIYRIIEKFKLS